MVKVHDEDTMAEPRQASTSSRHPQYRNGKSAHNTNNHLHHPHFHHYHHHWSYPASNLASSSASSSTGTATFHFGPGFEPRYPSGGSAGAAASSSTTTGGASQQHVVHFHVNPGVTVSFQMGDNVQVIKGRTPLTLPPATLQCFCLNTVTRIYGLFHMKSISKKPRIFMP
ncbi:uncharacterized protein [Periplaneta americana]|uniref:uncharacterized protein n=1 Tax=Periplaneta americana TaxID=6978 RepID=UPI0037E904FD